MAVPGPTQQIRSERGPRPRVGGIGPGSAVIAVLGLALSCLACGEARPNVLIVVLDTVRADRMSCYGYPRETTPRIDAFARDALVYERVVSTSNWTVPSHASMFTGLHTEVHGAVGSRAWLDDGLETLAEHFSSAGYETWLFGANPFVSSRHNMTQGFATTHHPWQPRWIEEVQAAFASRHAKRWPHAEATVPTKESGSVIRRAFADWLDTRDPDRKFFAFVNLMEAHRPWCPIREERARFLSPQLVERSYRMDHSYETRFAVTFGFDNYSPADLEAISGLYDASLWRLDRITGAILEELDRRGLKEDTLVVLVGDHGDHLGDHGLLGHEYSLYETLLRIPLIVRPPGGVADHGATPALQSTDIFGLVLNGANLASEPQPSREGPLVAAYMEPKRNAVEYVLEHHPELDSRDWLSPIRSIQVDGWKLIAWEDGRRELYHLAEDPGEDLDLFTEEPERVAALEWGLQAHIERFRSERASLGLRGGQAQLDPEHLKRLRDLGYAGE